MAPLTAEERAWLAVVRAARSGVLATVNEAGGVDLVPFVFALISPSAEAAPSADARQQLGRLVSVVDHKPKRHNRLKRLDNVSARPSVSVLVEHYDEDWSTLWWVRLRGEARVIEGGADHAAAIDVLAAKYSAYRQTRPDGAVLEIDLTELKAWSAGQVPDPRAVGE